MKSLLHTRITYVWLVLFLMTGVSWGLSEGLLTGGTVENSENNFWIPASLILVAFFKVRLIIMHFMEVSTALIPLRVVFELWVAIVCSAVLAMYFALFQ